MTQKLTLYSPAPPFTRLHALNVRLGELLEEGGLQAEIIPVALPDSINHISTLPAEERALRLPIVTVADLLPAIQCSGPDWHAYSRACPDLKLLASLYDVAFGMTVRDGVIEHPDDLSEQEIYCPPRPSSVRLLTEALVETGWGLGGRIAYCDAMPTDLGPAVGRGRLKATSWNITTLEGDCTTPNHRLMNMHFLPVDAKTLARLNTGLHFKIGRCEVDGIPLLAFRQGIAVWDETPPEIAEAILQVLTNRETGPFFSNAEALADWPGLPDTYRHPALLSLVGCG